MRYLVSGGTIINEGRKFPGDLLIEHGRISRIWEGQAPAADRPSERIDARGLLLIPGIIDDQVHFRDPGLTHKGDLYTESRAAIAGGITSFMEMPNTLPPTLSQTELQRKFERASTLSPANFSFYMGVSNENATEVLKTNPENVCGIKIFLGASTGNLLVDNQATLDTIFSMAGLPIAVHCEHEPSIQANLKKAKEQWGDQIPPDQHPIIRDHQACLRSTDFAIGLAKRYGTRLHVLHLSTAAETDLFESKTDPSQKRITAEVCVHHLWFSSDDYSRLGNHIKWNPAIKTTEDREGLWEALRSGKIDVVATDHAPHTLEEKSKPYLQSPSGGPLVQHSLPVMLECVLQGRLDLELLIEKMCHNPARIFRIVDRGFLREGYFADFVLVDPNSPWQVNQSNILYKCGWSPFEGQVFHHRVHSTFVNGHCVFDRGSFLPSVPGMPLRFQRDRRT